MYENFSQVIDRFAAVPTAHWIAVGVSIGIGTALLFYGWKLYRLGLIIGGGAAGAFGALWLADWTGRAFNWRIAPETAAIVGLLLGALAAWPLEKLAVLLVTGLAGAMVFFLAGLQTWQANPQMAGVFFGAAVLAFIVFAWLSQTLRQMMVIVATSVLGSTALIWFPMAIVFGRAGVAPGTSGEGDQAAHPSLKELPRIVLMVTTGLWLAMAGLGIYIQYRRIVDPERDEREAQLAKDRESEKRNAAARH